LFTSDGFNYNISNLKLNSGEVKFRKDNLWTSNWGSSKFPTGTGTQNGSNIPVSDGTYNITFDKSTGNFSFDNTLSNSKNSITKIKIYPNPTNSLWYINTEQIVESILLYDTVGKLIQSFEPKTKQFEINSSSLKNGTYFIKIKSGLSLSIQKIVKN